MQLRFQFLNTGIFKRQLVIPELFIFLCRQPVFVDFALMAQDRILKVKPVPTANLRHLTTNVYRSRLNPSHKRLRIRNGPSKIGTVSKAAPWHGYPQRPVIDVLTIDLIPQAKREFARRLANHMRDPSQIPCQSSDRPNIQSPTAVVYRGNINRRQIF